LTYQYEVRGESQENWKEENLKGYESEKAFAF